MCTLHAYKAERKHIFYSPASEYIDIFKSISRLRRTLDIFSTSSYPHKTQLFNYSNCISCFFTHNLFYLEHSPTYKKTRQKNSMHHRKQKIQQQHHKTKKTTIIVVSGSYTLIHREKNLPRKKSSRYLFFSADFAAILLPSWITMIIYFPSFSFFSSTKILVAFSLLSCFLLHHHHHIIMHARI